MNEKTLKAALTEAEKEIKEELDRKGYITKNEVQLIINRLLGFEPEQYVSDDGGLYGWSQKD